MNSANSPSVISARPPTLANPRLVKTSQSLDSSPSGLCRSSSFSMSSGYNSSPALASGSILYFSETVWVLTSSSLPSLEPGLESANGLSKPLESFDSQLDLLEEKPEKPGEAGDAGAGDSSRNCFVLPLAGGTNLSGDCSETNGLFEFRGLVSDLDCPDKSVVDRSSG